MTLSDINAKISLFTGADTTATGFATADRVISINNYKDRVITAILQSQDDFDFDDASITASYPIGKRNMVANQQDYKFSTALWALMSPEGAADQASAAISPLKIKRVEVSYDGGTTWYEAIPIDINEKSTDATQATINSVFSTTQPYYDIQFGAIFLYPIPIVNSTNGIKIWFDRSMTDFTSSDLTTGTKVPGFDTLFHPILAYGPSYEFGLAVGKDNTDPVKKELEQLMQEMRLHYGSKDRDRNWGLKAEPVTYN